MTNNLHYPDVMDAQCSKKVLSCRRVFFRSRSPAISRELTTLFSLESQDLMMSVFCSNTPVFAPKCLKCIERGPDFKIFPETRAFGVRKSRLTFATSLKSCWKPWDKSILLSGQVTLLTHLSNYPVINILCPFRNTKKTRFSDEERGSWEKSDIVYLGATAQRCVSVVSIHFSVKLIALNLRNSIY